MANGGIIFVSILALWAVYLVPVLVRERASRLDSRAGDRTSPAVRVLQRPPAQRPSHRVVLTADRPVVSADLPARPTRDLAAKLRAEAQRSRAGVRARAAGALLGVVALLVCFVAALAGGLPWWSLAVAGGWLTGVLAAGAIAASQRRSSRSVPAARTAGLPPRARRVATEVFDGRVARLSTGTAAPAAPADVTLPAAEQTTAVEQDVDRTWTPVDVPGPVYASKPASHRPPALPWSMPPVATVEASADSAADTAAGSDVAGDGQADQAGPAAASADGSADPSERYDEVVAEQRHSAAG